MPRLRPRNAAPNRLKIVVNMGVGSAIAEKKHMEDAVAALAQITGQKPLVTKSRKAIAGFRLREGMPIGCKVTLRGQRMYELLDRLISMAIPRVRDFRGLDSRLFDEYCFSDAAFCNDFKWSQPYETFEGVGLTVKWYLEEVEHRKRPCLN